MMLVITVTSVNSIQVCQLMLGTYKLCRTPNVGAHVYNQSGTNLH